ncbi:PREDICTED: fibulin-5-like, partial [Priapulus caudatus]|uniref:Fibulin-5-like n=1 Tax=Priapulus caudatus TaxID=37621 RepID=A0ABM1EVU6_PRICU
VDKCVNPSTHDCTQVCTPDKDAAKLYVCSCYPGFTYDDTDGTCSADTACDADNDCDATDGYCRLINSLPTCSCRLGYSLTVDNKCEVMDMCEQQTDTCDVANGGCVNLSDGGYECTCNHGYELLADDSCR